VLKGSAAILMGTEQLSWLIALRVFCYDAESIW